jgi:hypothetical protein
MPEDKNNAATPKALPIEGEGSALEVANAAEREIQLKGRQDPENYQMPDGRTLSEVRQELYEAHQKEAVESNKTQLKRVREQSVEGDPLYAEGASVVMTGGSATIFPAVDPTREETQIGGDLNKERGSHAEHTGDIGLTE